MDIGERDSQPTQKSLWTLLPTFSRTLDIIFLGLYCIIKNDALQYHMSTNHGNSTYMNTCMYKYQLALHDYINVQVQKYVSVTSTSYSPQHHNRWLVESCICMAATGVQKCTSVMFQHSPPLVQSLVLTILALQDGWSPLLTAISKRYLNIVNSKTRN